MSNGIKYFLIAVLLSVGCYYLYSIRPISAKEQKFFGEECRKWISSEFGENKNSRVGDSWRRRGRLVFEIMIEKEVGNSSTVMLCVADKATGSLIKPSIFDRDWN